MKLFFKVFLLLYLALVLGDGTLFANSGGNGRTTLGYTSERSDSNKPLQLRAVEVEEYDYKVISLQKWRSPESFNFFYDAAAEPADISNLFSVSHHVSFPGPKKYILYNVFRI